MLGNVEITQASFATEVEIAKAKMDTEVRLAQIPAEVEIDCQASYAKLSQRKNLLAKIRRCRNS